MSRFLLLLLLLLLVSLLTSLVLARPLLDPGSALPPSSDALQAAAAPQSSDRSRKHDKSIAGGEVIIGGLATAIFAAVFAYIRVTRKRTEQ